MPKILQHKQRGPIFSPPSDWVSFSFSSFMFSSVDRGFRRKFSVQDDNSLSLTIFVCVCIAHTRACMHTHTQRELSFTTLLVRLSHLKPAGKKNKKSAHTHKKKDNFRWTERNAYFLKEWPYVSHLLWENVCCENYLLQMYCANYAFFQGGEKNVLSVMRTKSWYN